MKRRFFFTFLLMLIFLLKSSFSQVNHYDNLLNETKSFFSFGYYSSSLQTALFSDNVFHDGYAKELIDINIIKNSLRLNETGSEKLMSNFSLNYLHKDIEKSIYLDLANFYFDNEKYRYALKWFSKIKDSDVPKNEINRYSFNKAYTLFSAKKYKKSKSYFEKIRNINKYESDTHYYLGHISYQLEDYDSAVQSFKNVTKNEQKKNLAYFQVDMNFKLGRFEKAIELGLEELKSIREALFISEISKIVGESYFNLKKYKNALKYLEKYKGKKGKWSNIDYYQLGYTYYKTGDYENAINQFNKIIQINNDLAQNAYYYLGDSYLKNNQKSAALSAFRKASKMNFDESIAEDAFLNYSKLSYEIGNPFEKVSNVLFNFLKKYPKNNSYKNIYNLLIDSYAKQKDYDSALFILKENKTFSNKELIQKISFLKAVELFKLRKYDGANRYFKQSIKTGNDEFYNLKSKYWSGRSFFALKKFDDALDRYKDFLNNDLSKKTDEHNRIYYDIAYTYFQLKEYKYALSNFQKALDDKKRVDKKIYNDIYLRIADCYFALKNYWPAMEGYNKIINLDSNKTPYAIYQKAISYGFVNRNENKIIALKLLINKFYKSLYTDDALFELAMTLSFENKFEESISYYDKILNDFQKSPYFLKSKLNKGLILYNQGFYENSRLVLEEFVLENKSSNLIQEALNVLKEISIDEGSFSDFTIWLKKENLNIYSDSEIEKNSFKSAEKKFLDKNYKQAIKLLETHLSKYPEGLNSLVSSYYIAEIYYSQNLFEESQKFYESIISKPTNEYTEKSLVRIIEIFKKNNDLEYSISYLEKLYEIAEFQENIRFALLNLMQAYFDKKDDLKSIEFSSKVLEIENIDDKLKWDANLIKARSLMRINDTLNSLKVYEKLEKISDFEKASEALYFKAYKNFKDKKFKSSIEVITNISKLSNNFNYWTVKALLLLSKNYISLNDDFQAVFILESLIENFNNYPNLVSESKSLLDAISENKLEKDINSNNENND
ncbi:MAG: hypothetical protein CMC88_01530 [Flavobacteriaceae bacterium]|nr:hypothetical protein [Flavobacteriaceae bacterium]